MKVLIAGCGYVGSALASRLGRAGDDVVALRRSASAIAGARLVRADLRNLGSLRAAIAGRRFDAVVYSASPDERSDEGYRRAYVTGLTHVLAVAPSRRVILIGSSGIQERGGGEWVEEDTPIHARGFVARRLLEAEALVRRAGGTTLRLGGIYGPGRERLIDNVAKGVATIPAQPLFTNRIHRDDAAGMIAHLLRLERPRSVYFGCDREAAPYGDVLRFLAAELGVEAPGEGPASRRSNKRIRCARIVRSGYKHLYPTYRQGYREVLRERASRT